MATAPPAARVIDEALVADLIDRQCPAFAGLPLVHEAAGWDTEVFRLGEGLLVRLPRREASAELVAREAAWLPRLPGLGIDLPHPVFVGRPSDAFSWTWSIVNRIPGTVASLSAPAERTAFAHQLADALWFLHTPAPGDAPVNPVRAVSLAQPAFDERVRFRAALDPRGDDLLARWEAWSRAAEFDGVSVWVHGDLHARNLVVGSEGRLTGILDWGDLSAGDPATDLATAWLTFDAEGRRAFLERTNDGHVVDDATWQRAKAWALHLGLALAQHNDDAPDLAAVGRHALEQVLAEAV